jgi:hypothetical protein
MDKKLKSVTLRDEHRLRVLKNGRLRKLFVPKKEKVIGDWVKLSNVTYQDLYCLPDIIRLIKLRE